MLRNDDDTMAEVNKLTTKVLRKSNGAKTSNGDTLLVWYEGSLMDGTVFDANYNFQELATRVPTYFQGDQGFLVQPAQPFEFKLGEGSVIQGWEKGLKGRKVGEVLELTIPSDQAYGEAGSGPIPPDADLRFEVEILGLLQDGAEEAKFPTLKDIGINTKKLKLSDADLANLSETKIGLDTNDRLIGSSAKDLLIGLKGNDRLYGAGGGDLLIGGAGKNHFLYTEVDDSLNVDGEQDTIVKFGRKDRINLRLLAEGGDLSFIGADKFSGVAGEVQFKKETLGIDLDGDKSADMAILMPGTSALKDANLRL